MKPVARFLSIVLLALCGAPCVCAGESAPDAQKLTALVTKLGAPAWQEREAAEAELRAVGAPVLPVLEEALKTTRDGEVRERAKRVRDGLELARLIDAVYKDFGTDPKKLEVAGSLAMREFRNDDARVLYLAAAATFRQVAAGKVKYAMSAEDAGRRADDLEMRAFAAQNNETIRGRTEQIRTLGGRAMPFFISGEDVLIEGIEEFQEIEESIIILR